MLLIKVQRGLHGMSITLVENKRIQTGMLTCCMTRGRLAAASIRLRKHTRKCPGCHKIESNIASPGVIEIETGCWGRSCKSVVAAGGINRANYL
jgi:hypothetical protein